MSDQFTAALTFDVFESNDAPGHTFETTIRPGAEVPEERLLPTGGEAGEVVTRDGEGAAVWAAPTGGGGVESVNGRTGAVVLGADDVGAATPAAVESAVEPRVLVCDENRRYDVGRLADGRPEFTHVVVTAGTRGTGGDPQAFGLMLPEAAGTFEEVRVVPGPDDPDVEGDILPFWLAEEVREVVPASSGGLDISDLFSLAINGAMDMEPTLIQTAITIDVSGQQTTATLDDTYESVPTLINDIDAGWAQLEGWAELVEITPDWQPGLWVRTLAEGAGQSVTVVSATGGDPLGALEWATIAGADESETSSIRGVLNRPDGTLGAPGGEGGTHNAPNETDPHMIGFTLVDAVGGWSNLGWATRADMSHGHPPSVRGDGPLGGDLRLSRLSNTLASLAMFVDPWERTVTPTSEVRSFRAAPGESESLGSVTDQDFVLALVGTSPDPGEVPHGLAFALPAADDARRHVAILKRPHDDVDGDVTVSAESGQIDGADDLTLNPGDCAVLYSTSAGEGHVWTVRSLHRHVDPTAAAVVSALAGIDGDSSAAQIGAALAGLVAALGGD